MRPPARVRRRPPRSLRVGFWAIATTLLLACEAPRTAGGRTDVLVVANATEAASLEVQRAYVAAREIPSSHVLSIPMPGSEEISRDAFSESVLLPIVRWFLARAEDDWPRCIVLCKGVPLRVSGSGGRSGDLASVDSELTLVPRFARGESVALEGPLPNPLFRGGDERAADGSLVLDPCAHGMSFVTRLDGFSTEDALALVARAVRAGAGGAGGRFLVDQRGDGPNAGENALARAAERLEELGVPVELEPTARFVADAESLAGYASWGSNDASYVRPFRFTWVAGGIASTFVSSSARTMHPPPEAWRPGPARHSESRFAGTTQSLVADLVQCGASGAAGNVAEPYLDGCVQPDVLLPAYASGLSLGESFYLAMPYLSWRAVVLGDPLCRIGRHRPIR